MNSAESQMTSSSKQSRNSLGILFNELSDFAWQINKGRLNAPNNYLSKIKLIRFANKNQQPITIDLLYLIENVFRSYNQTLQFNFWGLRLSDFCFGQLTSARALMPKLTNVTNLDLDSWDMSKLDAIIFVTWLKLVPNVRQLDMTSMDDSAKMILAKQLRQLVATDNRLMYILCRIQRVRIFTSTDKTDYPRQQLTYEIFTKIFPKAIVYRQ
ncbi:unnamed protein product [Rotaria sordida]|uniref:Uncharacterized protein n=1 Tax=Rotaria sordida TaxID=392033 RepID=A0A819HT44_9BILA|nr:unnamed protein product [Rotaria sordida]